MKTIRSLVTVLSTCLALGACNACTNTQTTAFKATWSTDEKCVASRVLSDVAANMSWENVAIDTVATCGEAAVVAYESQLASLEDAGATAPKPTPSLIAAFRARKSAAK